MTGTPNSVGICWNFDVFPKKTQSQKGLENTSYMPNDVVRICSYFQHLQSHPQILSLVVDTGTQPDQDGYSTKPGLMLPSSKLTWQRKITIFKRKYIFKRSIFHCYVSLPECIFCRWSGCFGTVTLPRLLKSQWTISNRLLIIPKWTVKIAGSIKNLTKTKMARSFFQPNPF